MSKRTNIITVANCEFCGEEFRRARTRGPKPKYCNDTCKARACDAKRGGPLPRKKWPKCQVLYLTCVVCGSEFTNNRSRQVCRSEECFRKFESRRNAAYQREYFLENGKYPGVEARDRFNKARRAQIRGTRVEPINPSEVYDRDGWVCQLCHEPVDRDLAYPDQMSASLDHILPLSLGGTHTWDNVQLAHLLCNSKKGNRVSELAAP